MYSSGYRTRPYTVQIRRTQTGNVIRAVLGYRPHKYPRLTGLLVLWLLGLYAMLLSPAPSQLTSQQIDKFNTKLKEIEVDSPQRMVAEERLLDARIHLEDAKVWFWRFKPEHRAAVNERRVEYKRALNDVRAFEKRHARILSEAKSQLGLWSSAGVEESRHLFWKSFQAGKVFGRQRTFWDSMFNLLTSRERNVWGMLIQLILTAVVNFTTGMLLTVFIFIFELPRLLASFQPSLLSALGFFVVALIGALSVVAAWLLGLYATGATAVYAVAAVANANLQLQGRSHRRPPIRHHMD